MPRSTPPSAFELPDKYAPLAVDSGWSTVPPAPARVLGTAAATLVQDEQPSGLKRVPTKARAEGTLLGVAPPPPSAPNAAKARNPVVVHSGVAKPEAAPLPIATEDLPVPVAPLSRRPPPVPQTKPPVSDATPPLTKPRLVDREPATSWDRAQALTAPVAPGAVLSSRAVAPTLGEAMKSRVRFAGAEASLWSLQAPLVGLLMVGIAVAAVVGTWRLGAARRAPEAGPPAATSPIAQAVSPPIANQEAPDTAQLEAKSSEALNANEVLMLSNVRLERERQAAKLFREKLEHDPSVLKDKAVLAQLRKLTLDPNTAHEALAAVAGLPSPQSADLLFEIWTATPNRTATSELARALLFSRDVRAKASAALSVALELRAAETCPANLELLPKAAQVADRRSTQPLAKLLRKQGCGPNKKQDCFACLRDGNQLNAAIAAAKGRRAPTPFAALLNVSD